MSFIQDFQHRAILPSSAKVVPKKVNTVFRTPTITKRTPAFTSTDNTGINDLSLFTGQGPRGVFPLTNTVWNQLKIGGGGFSTGISIANDGTKIIRIDVGGGYVSVANGLWKQLVTSNSMPAGVAGPPDSSMISKFAGLYEAVIAPNDSNRIYIYFNGNVYKSINQGSTFTATSFSTVLANANTSDNIRLFGTYMAVDPQNHDVLIVGTPGSGVFYTTDGGTTFNAISTATIAAGTSAGSQGGGNLIAFDPNSGVVGGKTQGIYISSYGTGVYHTISGITGSWALTTGTPTTHAKMICDQGGNVWFLDNSTFNLHKYTGTWATMSGAGTIGSAVAVDPANVNNVFVVNNDGTTVSSTNGGTTWTASGIVSRVSNDIGWLAAFPNSFMSSSNAVFDSTGSNKLYLANGNGVWWSNPPTNSSGITWNSQTAGIEDLVANEIISPPGGKPVVAAWDFGVFYVNNPDIYPSIRPYNTSSLQTAWSIDYASANPSEIIVYTDNSTAASSSDGGQNYTIFPTFPASTQHGGYFAATTSSDFLWVSSNGSLPYYTTDGGTNWNPITIAGIGASGGGPNGSAGWNTSSFFWRQCACADRVDPTTYYAYNYDTTIVYKSTNAGVSWSAASGSNPFSSTAQANAKMHCVPGQSGHLFFTSANGAGSGQLYRSTDHAATWTQVANTDQVADVGFGLHAPSQSYPAIYFAGRLNGVYGIYRSIDNAVTWTFLTDFPLGNFDQVKTISGDMNTYGTVYVGFVGTGFMYGKLQ